MNDTDNGRLDRLLEYLDHDPFNADLLIDAVEAAIAAGEFDRAESLNDRLRQILPGAFQGTYLAGTIAMKRGDFSAASDLFEPLVAEQGHSNVRFNFAWSQAMLGRKREALALLDTATIEAIPAAAMLRVQLIHEQGEFDEAMKLARRMLEIHPDDAGLNAAAATLALDVEDGEMARACAAKAGDNPEALSVTALLELRDGDTPAARRAFDQAIALREHNPRAWIGRGMTSLLERDPATAARDIDHGAQQFGDHLGSWIAAGWAHCLAGNIEAARQRFEHALALDRNFAESHGSLAALDVMAGDKDSARRGVATALRLDPQCFSAALARALLSNDDPRRAGEIVQVALNTPLSEQGRTIASYVGGLTLPTVH